MEFVLWVYFDDLPTGWVSRFYCRPRFQDFFFFKQAFLFIKSVKDIFVGVEFWRPFVLNSIKIVDWNLFFVGARCIQEERFSQHEKRYYFDMAEIDFGLLFFSLLPFSNQAFFNTAWFCRTCLRLLGGAGPSWARSSAERLFWVELCRVLEFSKSQTEWNPFQRDSKVFSLNFRSAAHEFLLLFSKNKFANRERDGARRKFLHRGPA